MERWNDFSQRSHIRWFIFMKICFTMNLISNKLFYYLSFSYVSHVFIIMKPIAHFTVKVSVSGRHCYDNIVRLEVLCTQYDANATECFHYQCFKCSSSVVLCFPVIVVCCRMRGRKWWDDIWHPGKCTARTSGSISRLATCWTLTRYACREDRTHFSLSAVPNACISISFDIKGILTFPSHGKFIEEVRHKVSTTGCRSHCWETKTGSY